jgi:glycosyltransferase involved in cell wall biosynthesis
MARVLDDAGIKYTLPKGAFYFFAKSPIEDDVEFVGLLNPKERKKYLANAKAVISPSHYPEPFGLTAVEAGLSGTPIISTDHGGYTETVVDGYNGFRCSYFNDFVMAINNRKEFIIDLQDKMKRAALDLDFETAAKLRDKLRELQAM